MEGLTSEDIASLFAPRKAAQAKVGFAIIRTDDGTKKVPLSGITVGAFEGRSGSIRRNRKGGTRRLANGRRQYVGQYEKPEVIAYLVQ